MSTLIKACVGFAFCVCALAQSSPTGTAQLSVAVRSEAVLAWQGAGTVLVAIRMAPGTLVIVWQDESCSTPLGSGQVISASGRYTIVLASIGGFSKLNVCLASNDGALHTYLPAH